MKVVAPAFAVLAPIVIGLLLSSTKADASEPAHRSFQVVDSIEMSVLHEQRAGIVTISPNGDRFFFVESSGRVAENVREFRLRVFSSSSLDKIFSSPASASLRDESTLRFDSSSNEDAITDARWVDDGKRIAFLGAKGDDAHQVYVYDLASQTLNQITDSEHGVHSFDYRDGTCIFAALIDRGVPDYSGIAGVTVTDESLPTLIFPDQMFNRLAFATFVTRPEWKQAKQIGRPQRVQSAIYNYSIAPDGTYAVAVMPPEVFPELWHEYLPPEYERAYTDAEMMGFQYQRVDLKTLDVEEIVDAPVSWIVWNRSKQVVRWSDDGTKLMLTSTMAPLNESRGRGDDTRRQQPIVLVQEMESGRLGAQFQVPFFDALSGAETIVNGKWNAANNSFEVTTSTGRAVQSYGESNVGTNYAIEYRDKHWVQSATTRKATIERLTNNGLRLGVKQDANTPPDLWATDTKTGAGQRVLQLNPQIDALTLAEVQPLTWSDESGREWSGSLLLPADKTEGDPIPLVIELKFASPSEFRPDGPYTTAFASQALANAGMAVLEFNAFDQTTFNTPLEAPTQLIGIEAAIDHLNRKGLIDRDRVGLIGFSRTTFYVRYALTHSDIEFAAATVSDGVDGGYLQFNVFTLNYYGAHENGGSAALYEALPYGEGMERWLEAAPTFNTHRVRTPVRIEAIGLSSALQEWEFFSALKIQGIPAEMIYIPHGTHVLVKPQERLISQQGNVDWFRYWLFNERSDKADSQQYARWDQLREIHTQRATQTRPALLDWRAVPRSEIAGQADE